MRFFSLNRHVCEVTCALQRFRMALGRSRWRKPKEDADMTRDKLIREYRNAGSSWPALLIVYGMLVGTLLLTAQAIV